VLREIIDNYVVAFFFGTILGFIITRYYYEKNRNYNLGRTIESVLISSSVKSLWEYHKKIDQLLSNMRLESDALTDQIKRFQDIEKTPIDKDTLRIELESARALLDDSAAVTNEPLNSASATAHIGFEHIDKKPEENDNDALDVEEES
jgi:hypothetical protein